MNKTITMKEAANFIQLAIDADSLPPVLLGEAGIGKSSLIKNIAHNRYHSEAFVLSMNTMADRSDLTGVRLMPTADKTSYEQRAFPHETVMEAIAYAKKNPKKPVILFTDEFNRATDDITSATFQLITERRLGSVKLPNNIKIIAAGNDRGNVTAVDSASVSRLTVFHVVPDLETYLEVNPLLNSYLRDWLTKNPKMLVSIPVEEDEIIDDDDPDSSDDDDEPVKLTVTSDEIEQFSQITTPRTLTSLSNMLNKIGLDGSHTDKELGKFTEILEGSAFNEDTSKLDILVEGAIGNTPAKESFIDYMQKSYDALTNIATNITGAAAFTDPTKELDIEKPVIDNVKELIQNAKNTSDIETYAENANQNNPDLFGRLITWLMYRPNTKVVSDNNDNQLEKIITLIQTGLNLITFKTNLRKTFVKILSNSDQPISETYPELVNMLHSIEGTNKTAENLIQLIDIL
jgi:MoxR-like ATPase